MRFVCLISIRPVVRNLYTLVVRSTVNREDVLDLALGKYGRNGGNDIALNKNSCCFAAKGYGGRFGNPNMTHQVNKAAVDGDCGFIAASFNSVVASNRDDHVTAGDRDVAIGTNAVIRVAIDVNITTGNRNVARGINGVAVSLDFKLSACDSNVAVGINTAITVKSHFAARNGNVTCAVDSVAVHTVKSNLAARNGNESILFFRIPRIDCTVFGFNLNYASRNGNVVGINAVASFYNQLAACDGKGLSIKLNFVVIILGEQVEFAALNGNIFRINTILGNGDQRAVQNGDAIGLYRFVVGNDRNRAALKDEIFNIEAVILNLNVQAALAANGQVAIDANTVGIGIEIVVVVFIVKDSSTYKIAAADKLDNKVGCGVDKSEIFLIIIAIVFIRKALARELIVVQREHAIFVVSVATRGGTLVSGLGSARCEVIAIIHTNAANVKGCAPFCRKGYIGKLGSVEGIYKNAVIILTLIGPADEREPLGVRKTFGCGDISSKVTTANLNSGHCPASLAKVKGNGKYCLNISRRNILNSCCKRGYGGNGVSLVIGVIIPSGIKCAEGCSKGYNISDRDLCIGKIVKLTIGSQMCVADIERAAIVGDVAYQICTANSELGATLQFKCSMNVVIVCIGAINLLFSKESNVRSLTKHNLATIGRIEFQRVAVQIDKGLAANGNVAFR